MVFIDSAKYMNNVSNAATLVTGLHEGRRARALPKPIRKETLFRRNQGGKTARSFLDQASGAIITGKTICCRTSWRSRSYNGQIMDRAGQDRADF